MSARQDRRCGPRRASGGSGGAVRGDKRPWRRTAGVRRDGGDGVDPWAPGVIPRFFPTPCPSRVPGYLVDPVRVSVRTLGGLLWT